MEYTTIQALPGIGINETIVKVNSKWVLKSDNAIKCPFDPAKHPRFFREHTTTLQFKLIGVASKQNYKRYHLSTNTIFNEEQAEILRGKLPEIKAFVEGLF